MKRSRSLSLGPRSRSATWLLLAGFLGLAGCESERPGVPSASTDSVMPQAREDSTPRTFGLVLTETNPVESAYYDTFLRAYAAREDVILAVSHAKAGEQSQAIRTLAEETLSALIVVPDADDPPIEALGEARELGIPIVLLGSSVEIDPPLTSVTFGSLEQAAETIVSALEAAAKKEGAAPDAPVVILLAEGMGTSGRERVEAFRKAPASTSHVVLPEATFDTNTLNEATEAVRAVLRKHEDLAMVISVEEQAGLGSAQVRDSQLGKMCPIVVGGFYEPRDLAKSPLDKILQCRRSARPTRPRRSSLRRGIEAFPGTGSPQSYRGGDRDSVPVKVEELGRGRRIGTRRASTSGEDARGLVSATG